MRFSETYGITRTDDDDWFDPLLLADTNLCVDPFMIYDDADDFWAQAHDDMIDFFVMVLKMVKAAKGNKKSPSWGKAKSLLLFPEPDEFCLGVTEGSPRGAGSGKGLQEPMLRSASIAVQHNIESVEHVEELVLFQEGMGLDRISDMVCNILKSYFIQYTQNVARCHSVKMERIRVRHSSWDNQNAKWRDEVVELPRNPYTGSAVLLVPGRFLRALLTVNVDDFWDWAWRQEPEALRANFNYDLAWRVPAAMKAKMASQNPELVKTFMRECETHEKVPYDIENDPLLRTSTYELGTALATDNPLSFTPAKPDEFHKFIEALVAAYAHGIEQSDAWRLLWDKNKFRPESACQSLFRFAAAQYCRANKIDLTSEANAGRGPVDFKFVQNWDARALIEMKLANNSKFWHGLNKQTVQYLKSEDLRYALFVCICFEDDHFDREFQREVRDLAAATSVEFNVSIKPMFIDARRKQSASKVK
ncbi:hypothetical protein [Actinomadura rubrisoli]|uniref:Uncharacterized protein n=1 Tax=Actinomadura rubrisoli TaxID=2530368 RepID=A0A4R5AW78_9ACTN|nr:hypothetical protein [Actinomadura rubrisoli]TDD75414.1 hypothetical protein E1298_31550 [Actinomadura rubrisoli]